MPVVSDFTFIQGDDQITIGDGNTLWEANFSTSARVETEPALLIFNVRGLTDTNVDVVVRVNDIQVGTIRRYNGGSSNAGNWFTQMIRIEGATLVSGSNELRIEAVGWPGSTVGNLFDDFDLKDVVCFFHQAV